MKKTMLVALLLASLPLSRPSFAEDNNWSISGGEAYGAAVTIVEVEQSYSNNGSTIIKLSSFPDGFTACGTKNRVIIEGESPTVINRFIAVAMVAESLKRKVNIAFGADPNNEKTFCKALTLNYGQWD